MESQPQNPLNSGIILKTFTDDNVIKTPPYQQVFSDVLEKILIK